MGDAKAETSKLNELTQDCYRTLSECVRTVNTFPTGSARDLFSTYTSFNVVVDHLSDNILLLANSIVQSQGMRGRFNKEATSIDYLVQANDEILDRAHQVSSGVGNTTESSGYKLSTMGAKQKQKYIASNTRKYEKPQKTFKIEVDNSSNTIWRPKLTYKPNCISPFCLEEVCDRSGNIIGYNNPYSYEIENNKMDHAWLTLKKDIDVKPVSETKFTYVDSEKELQKLVQHLETVDAMTVDVEHHSLRSYMGITCLLQISTERGGDFVIDAFALWNNLQCLNDTFTNPKIIKVLHGAKNDVLWLQRDLGIYINGLFDTFEAAKVLGLKYKKLSDLVSLYCGKQLDKTMQMTDWSVRPLTSDQLMYARLDTHYLLCIWQRMLGQLLEQGDKTHNLVRAVHEQSCKTASQYYIKQINWPNSYKKLYEKSKLKFGPAQDSALKQLYEWRDQLARKLDESPCYVAPDHTLLKLAEHLPRSAEDIVVCSGILTSIMRERLVEIQNIISTCPELQKSNAVINVASNNTVCLQTDEDVMQLETSKEKRIKKTPVYRNKQKRFSPMNLPDLPLSYCNADFAKYISPYLRYQLYRSMRKGSSNHEMMVNCTAGAWKSVTAFPKQVQKPSENLSGGVAHSPTAATGLQKK